MTKLANIMFTYELSEETVITRLGELCSSRSMRRLVSKNGARWLIASVVSIPSGVSVRLL